MESRSHMVLQAPDRSHNGLIKKQLKSFAQDTGMAGTALGEFEIIISELLSNLAKYTSRGGTLLVKVVSALNGRSAIELICLDNGPGISDLAHMMGDGVSTGNSLGQGLGAIKRLSDEFDMFSQPGWGTAVFCRKNIAGADKAAVYTKDRAKVIIGNVMVPKPGEQACGDGWACSEKDGLVRVLCVDGLGHGPEAEKAALAAIEVFHGDKSSTPSLLLQNIHVAIRRTRGVVGCAAFYDTATNGLQFCGVGNTMARLYSHIAPVRSFTSYNGIIGMNRPGQMNDHQMTVAPGQHLIMSSDGLRTNWDLAKFPNVFRSSPTLMAAVLYKEFVRGTDDALSLVIRFND